MPFYLPKPQAEKSSQQVLVCKNSVKIESPDQKASPASYKDNDAWEYPVLYFYVIVEIKRAINAAQNRRDRRRETRNMAVLMRRAEVSASMKEAPQAEPVFQTRHRAFVPAPQYDRTRRERQFRRPRGSGPPRTDPIADTAAFHKLDAAFFGGASFARGYGVRRMYFRRCPYQRVSFLPQS